MSGTSLDGADAAVVRFEAGLLPYVVGWVHRSFSAELRTAALGMANGDAITISDVCLLNVALGEEYAAVAALAAAQCGIDLGEVACIACHGQTVRHQPLAAPYGGTMARGTLQLGEPAVIAARTGCRVISNFRAADLAAGGQGAPLVPFADRLLFTRPNSWTVVLNLGGIANVTILPPAESMEPVTAFDIGPGNMIIDALAVRFSGQAMDVDGALAGSGSVDADLLSHMMELPYLKLAPPKSTGRELFGTSYVQGLTAWLQAHNVTDADLMATVTRFTAECLTYAAAHWFPKAEQWDLMIVGGGGVNNPTLMQHIRDAVPAIVVKTHEELGIPNQAKEALAFAILGAETLAGRPGNVPSATGARGPAILGSITPAPRR